tara:strand:+ start:1321 stop:2046 length:726 start_codon:yes stop_codon:yes gene_type:complete
MILCVDIGNSNIVYALWNGETFTNIQRIETSESNIEIPSKSKISQVAITSVVPSLTNYYNNYFNQSLDISPFVVNHGNCQIHLDVETPEDVGPDRICNVYGAKEKYGCPAIVIDFGSATTYDVINEDGRFIGGAIAPGIDVSANYLIQKAALLKTAAFKFPDKVIAKSTETNLQSGIMYGGLDSIEGMINRIKNELKIDNIEIILTGGFSSIISGKLSIKHSLDKTITLLGLKLIFEHNQS